jgi:hypothetical protein
MARKTINIVSLFSILILLVGCATNLGQAKNELSNAAKTCAERQWPDVASHMACLDIVEAPIIQKRIPSALASFNAFAAKRRYLAQQADIMNAKAIKAAKPYRLGLNEAVAILRSHEPKFADANSTLFREWMAANPSLVCKQETAVARGECGRDILRPIWERDAPDTIVYFDEFQKKNIELSRKFDANTSPEAAKRARAYFAQGMKEALAEWKENANRDIQAANQQDAVARAQAFQAFGNFLAGVAEVSLDVAQARYAQQPVSVTVISHR